MRGFWLTGSVIFLVLILLVAFENIQATCSYVTFLFYEVGAEIAPTFTFFGMAMLGVITGIFIFGFMNSVFNSSSEEEDDGDM